MKNLFHLAFPVHDLNAAREFYGGVMECPEGRSSECWIDFDLYGHQIVTHLAPDAAGAKITNHVDADHVTWQQAFSFDGGTTWKPNWHMNGTRAKR